MVTIRQPADHKVIGSDETPTSKQITRWNISDLIEF